jgi:type 1 glutamine amidotransferase
MPAQPSKICPLLAALTLLAHLAAAQVGAAAKPIRTLILSGRNNHDWKQTTPALKRIYETSGRFLVDVTDDPASCDAATFAQYDVIVSNWSNFSETANRDWGPETENAFLDFVRGGKGFVLFHAASATFSAWPEFQEIIGSTWGKETGHGALHAFRVTISDKDHPVTRGVSDFWTRDELWHRTQKRPGIRVLATAFSAKEKGGSGEFEPVILTTRYGKGRCFHFILGHDVQAIENVGWRTLMLRGTEWAAKGKVTIPVPDNWPVSRLGAEAAGGEPDAASLGLEPSPGAAAPTKESVMGKADYSWRKSDASLALLSHGRVVWQLNFDKKEGKPYFHPLALSNGADPTGAAPALTWLRPPDHPWHRALWFSWKSLAAGSAKGLNYWEENPETGLSEGLTEIADVRLGNADDFSARIEMQVAYRPPGAAPVLTEKRTLAVSAPDEAGRYRIDWRSAFTAAEDVVLDRTPIPGEEGGVGYGGYGGLSVRLIEDPSGSGWRTLDSEGRRSATESHGKAARWLDYSTDFPSGSSGGVAVFDHPGNPRHPSPWYATTGGMVYFSPAFLFRGPHTLPRGESLTLRYRVLVHPGLGEKEFLEREWEAFSR